MYKYICIHTHTAKQTVYLCVQIMPKQQQLWQVINLGKISTHTHTHWHTHTRTTIEAFPKTSRHTERDNNNSNKRTNIWKNIPKDQSQR